MVNVNNNSNFNIRKLDTGKNATPKKSNEVKESLLGNVKMNQNNQDSFIKKETDNKPTTEEKPQEKGVGWFLLLCLGAIWISNKAEQERERRIRGEEDPNKPNKPDKPDKPDTPTEETQNK